MKWWSLGQTSRHVSIRKAGRHAQKDTKQAGNFEMKISG